MSSASKVRPADGPAAASASSLAPALSPVADGAFTPSAEAVLGAARPRARSTSIGHRPALDGVRGLAVLSVLLYHFVAQTVATNGFERVLDWALAYGLLGVDLFFILSGFLITGILYDARDEPDYFRSFYMRRVVRIFPLYYGVLAVVFFIVPLIPSLRETSLGRLHEHQAWAWLYGVNVYLSFHGGWGALSYLDHFWSLAVEEHFYFVWPLLIWLFRKSPRALLRLALGVALLSFASRMVASLAGVDQVVTVVLTPFQLDALCLGGFFAIYVREAGVDNVVKRALLPMAAAALMVAILAFGIQHYSEVGPLALQPLRRGMYRILLAALLLWAFAAPASSLVSRFFRSRPMVTLGKYSYGLYVYHHFLSYYFTTHRTEFELGRLVGSHTLAVAIQAVVGIGLSMAVAWVSFEYFEKPFLRLKRFWPSAQERAAATA
jgi:peptidoglycan/LPS O-acetylase OafA/YrhL